jgi:hypothetical protein
MWHENISHKKLRLRHLHPRRLPSNRLMYVNISLDIEIIVFVLVWGKIYKINKLNSVFSINHDTQIACQIIIKRDFPNVYNHRTYVLWTRFI